MFLFIFSLTVYVITKAKNNQNLSNLGSNFDEVEGKDFDFEFWNLSITHFLFGHWNRTWMKMPLGTVQ